MRTMLMLLLFVSASLSAQTVRCTTDAYGYTSCRSSAGATYRSHTDRYGYTSGRDDRGNTYRGYTDALGNSRLRSSTGNTWRGRRDPIGTTWTDSNGTRLRCTTDAFGVTRCR